MRGGFLALADADEEFRNTLEMQLFGDIKQFGGVQIIAGVQGGDAQFGLEEFFAEFQRVRPVLLTEPVLNFAARV